MKKNYLKIMLLSIGFLFLPLTLWAETDPATMILDTKDGQKYSFLLSDNIIITYSENEMLLNGDGIQTSFAINDVYNFYFTGDLTGTTGIQDLTVAPDMAFRYISPNVYEISGSSVVGVNVYDLSGQNILSTKARDSVTVDLNALSSGVYLLNAKMRNSSQTIKIVKK